MHFMHRYITVNLRQHCFQQLRGALRLLVQRFAAPIFVNHSKSQHRRISGMRRTVAWRMHLMSRVSLIVC